MYGVSLNIFEGGVTAIGSRYMTQTNQLTLLLENSVLDNGPTTIELEFKEFAKKKGIRHLTHITP